MMGPAALIIGTWGCTLTFEKELPETLAFAANRTVVTSSRRDGRAGPWMQTPGTYVVAHGMLTITENGATTESRLLYHGTNTITFHAVRVRPKGGAWMAFPGTSDTSCRRMSS